MSFGPSGGGGPGPSPLPDLGKLWKTYSGWFSNINRRNEGELAAVRARLSAAGADPDLVKMQTEHLESQRKKEIEDIQNTETFKALNEVYRATVHGAANPYAGQPLGWEQWNAPPDNWLQTVRDAQASENPWTPTREEPPPFVPRDKVSFEEYYTEFYGAPSTGIPEEEARADAAKNIAKRASSGLTTPAGNGAGKGTAPNPWVDENSFTSLFL